MKKNFYKLHQKDINISVNPFVARYSLLVASKIKHYGCELRATNNQQQFN